MLAPFMAAKLFLFAYTYQTAYRQCTNPAEPGAAAQDGSHMDEHVHGHLQ